MSRPRVAAGFVSVAVLCNLFAVGSAAAAGQLYFLKSNSGILTCLDAREGTLRFSERLESVPSVYASPVGAAGRVYIAGREGAVAVLAAGPKLEVLATNRLDDGFDASPALVDGEIYLRGRKHLYRVSAD